jgi:hypothetical protein
LIVGQSPQLHSGCLDAHSRSCRSYGSPPLLRRVRVRERGAAKAFQDDDQAAAKRALIDTGRDEFYVRAGKFNKGDEIGRSLSLSSD